HLDLVMPLRLEPQRPIGEMLEGFQHFAAPFQQNLLVAPIQIGNNFRLAWPVHGGNRPHVHFQIKSRSANHLFQKAPQRFGRGLAVQSAVLKQFMGHCAPGRGTSSAHKYKLAQPFLPRAALAGAAGGWLRFRYHCCTMPTRLLVRMYTASPLGYGITTNIAAIPMGITFIIICCCGSVVVIGVIFVAKYMDSPISTGRM